MKNFQGLNNAAIVGFERVVIDSTDGGPTHSTVLWTLADF